MFYPDLFPSKEIQEEMFQKITREHIEEFFDRYLAQYYLTFDKNVFSKKLDCYHIEWGERKFEREELREQIGDNVVYFMNFNIINDCSVRSVQRLGCTLFNLFDYDLNVEGRNFIIDYENLTKKWIKFLKEKFPEYAPLLEGYKKAAKIRVKEINEKRLKSAEQENDASLKELETVFGEN